MFPTPRIGKLARNLANKVSFGMEFFPLLHGLNVLISVSVLQLQRNSFWHWRCMCVSYSLLESWVLAAHPQASISGATGSPGKQHWMGTEILTNDELPWISRHLGTGTGPFLQNRPVGNLPGHSSNLWDIPSPIASTPATFTPAYLEKNSPSSPPAFGKLWLPPGGELHNSSPLQFLSTRPLNTRDQHM